MIFNSRNIDFVYHSSSNINVDFQLSDASALEGQGMMLCAGDVRKRSAFVEALCDRLAVLIDEDVLRGHISEQMREIVDGDWAERLADEFISILRRKSE